MWFSFSPQLPSRITHLGRSYSILLPTSNPCSRPRIKLVDIIKPTYRCRRTKMVTPSPSKPICMHFIYVDAISWHNYKKEQSLGHKIHFIICSSFQMPSVSCLIPDIIISTNLMLSCPLCESLTCHKRHHYNNNNMCLIPNRPLLLLFLLIFRKMEILQLYSYWNALPSECFRCFHTKEIQYAYWHVD